SAWLAVLSVARIGLLRVGFPSWIFQPELVSARTKSPPRSAPAPRLARVGLMLTPGTTLGSYEIRSSLGAGGMGEVYRARDTKLHREVALNVLPDALATDADRLARIN